MLKSLAFLLIFAAYFFIKMGCLKLSYYQTTELKIISNKKVLTLNKTENNNRSGYRYGFNGKENDNEVKGEGNQQDYGMRIYEPRLGRFLSVDPITRDYPELTPYQFASNSPIAGIDRDGLEFNLSTYMFREAKITTVTADKVVQKVKDAPKQTLKDIEKAGPVGGAFMLTGYGFTLFGNPEVGIPLVKIGGAISLASDIAEVANTFDDKGVKPGLRTLGKKALLEAAGLGLKIPVDNLKTFTKLDKEIVNTGIDLKLKIVEKIIEVTEEAKDKKNNSSASTSKTPVSSIKKNIKGSSQKQ